MYITNRTPWIVSLDLWKMDMDRIEQRAVIKTPLCTSHMLSKQPYLNVALSNSYHPPFSPGQAPSDYYLFRYLESHRARFPDDEYLKDTTENDLKSSLKSSIIHKLWVSKTNGRKYIEIKGDYIEKWSPSDFHGISTNSPFYEFIDCPTYVA